MEIQKSNARPNDLNIVAQTWNYYFAYWPWFLLITFTCMFGVYLYIRYTTPLYAATTTVIVKDQKKGVNESKVLESLDMMSSSQLIENEAEVIKSRSLMDAVVDKMKLYAPVFHEGNIRSESAHYFSPIKIEAQHPEAITPVKKIRFQYDSLNNYVLVDKQRYALNEWVNTPYGTLRFYPNPSRTEYRSDAKYFFALKHPKKVTYNLLLNLDVLSVNKLSTVLTIQIKDELPKRAEEMLNLLMKEYNQSALEDKNRLAANTLAFLDERLAGVKEELDSIEQRIQSYKADKGALDIGSEGRMFLENVSQNDQRISDFRLQLAVLDQVEGYVSSGTGGGIVPSSLGVNDPILTQLLQRLSDHEIEYERMRKTTAENNPALVSIKDQIEKVKSGILNNITSQRRNLQASRSNLSGTNSSLTSMLRTIPKKERDLVEISRQQNITANIYNLLMQKKEEAALSYSSLMAENRVVDKAQSGIIPVSPNKLLLYLVAFILSMVLTICIISGKELFNNKVLYRKQIEALTSFPVIGEVSHSKEKGKYVIGEGVFTPVAEQFRKLRNSLKYINIDKERKKILITSSIPGEGKSFVCSNLGITLALTGKRVILLELDLVNPALGHMFEKQTEKGLSDYLKGECCADDIIRHSEVHERLDVLPAGDLPLNPTELMMNGRLNELFSYLDGIYDYIIVDSAPVAAFSDAFVMSSLCDATLYVVRHNYTPKVFIERLEEEAKLNDMKNVSIIFNGVTPRGFGKTASSYGYNYHYAYQNKKYLKARKIKHV